MCISPQKRASSALTHIRNGVSARKKKKKKLRQAGDDATQGLSLASLKCDRARVYLPPCGVVPRGRAREHSSRIAEDDRRKAVLSGMTFQNAGGSVHGRLALMGLRHFLEQMRCCCPQHFSMSVSVDTYPLVNWYYALLLSFMLDVSAKKRSCS